MTKMMGILKDPPSPLQLHLGCGKIRLPDFINIDLAHLPSVDIVHDVMRLPMFHNDMVDLIYACHVLEYFDREEAKIVLTEWYRVLRIGGILRLAVPDFKAITRAYNLGYGLDDKPGIHNPLYGKMQIDHKWIYHKTVYDYASLVRLLNSVGFGKARPYDWRETSHSGIDDFSQSYLPHMDKDNGILISLNVEATKI